jgi:hypothetical protein
VVAPRQNHRTHTLRVRVACRPARAWQNWRMVVRRSSVRTRWAGPCLALLATGASMSACGGESVRYGGGEVESSGTGGPGGGNAGAQGGTGGSTGTGARGGQPGGGSAGAHAESGGAGGTRTIGGSGGRSAAAGRGTGGRSTAGSGTGGSGGDTTAGAGGKGIGGTAQGGGGGCAPINCPLIPPCPDGTLVSVACGCPVCSCADTACPANICANGYELASMDGSCCGTCVPVKPYGCDEVSCEPIGDCPVGTTMERPPGSCCPACVPNAPPTCEDSECASDCPLGYTPGNGTNGCCYDCVPDPSFCETYADCYVATDASSCCGCAEAISERMFVDDPCYVSPDVPRSPPAQCQPGVCNVSCPICSAPVSVSCVNYQCIGNY